MDPNELPSPPPLPLNSPDPIQLNGEPNMPPLDLLKPLSPDDCGPVESEIVQQTSLLAISDNLASPTSDNQATAGQPEKSTSFFASMRRPKIITNLLRRESSSSSGKSPSAGGEASVLMSTPISPIDENMASKSQQIPIVKRKSSHNAAYSATALSSQSSISSGTMSLSRRPTKKSDSGFSTNTMRFPRKLLDAIGFDRGTLDSIEDVTSVGEDSVISDDEDHVEAVTPIYTPCPVHVYWNMESQSVLIDIRRQDTVGEAIDLYLEYRKTKGIDTFSNNNAVTSDNNFGPLPSTPGEGFSMFKVDRNALASRIWLPNERAALDANIKDGDELRIFDKSHTFNFSYSIPPHDGIINHEFSYDETVGDVLNRIVVDKSLPDKCGLYYRKMGLWLDERKLMVAYEFPVDTCLEVRAYGQDFLLRVQIPDCDLKLTLKVIPSLTTSDVESMIAFNLKNKHISLDPFIRGYSDIYTPPCFDYDEMNPLQQSRKRTTFALYHSSAGKWLAESETLAESGIDPNSLDTQLQYKVRYYPMTICLPDYMLHSRRNERLKMQSPSGEHKMSNMMQLLISENMIVSDVLAVLQMGNPFSSSVTSGKYDFALFTKGLEMLKNSESAWNVISNSSPFEIFEYHGAPKKYTFGTNLDEFSRVTVELDPTCTLQQAVSVVCRRFGLNERTEFSGFYICGDDGRKVVLDLEIRLFGFDLSSDLIMIQISPLVSAIDSLERNIWLEGPDYDGNISYSSGENAPKELLAGTLNKLVEKLTLSDENNDSSDLMDFVKTFILTYKSFTTPAEFLKKLVERYHVPRQRNLFPNFEDFEKQRVKVQLRVANVLNQWTKKYAFDFTDISTPTISMTEARKMAIVSKHKLLLDVLEFTENVIVYDHPTSGKQLRKNILKLRENGHLQDSKREMKRMRLGNSKIDRSVKLNLFSMDAIEIAKNLTVLEFDLFSRVMPYEFLNQSWTKKDAAKLAPNLIAITKRFNDVAFWIVNSILEVKTVKARAKRFAKLIDIAGHLYKLNNFSTLMAFIAGFSKAAINRLRFTAKEMSTKTLKKFSHLESIMSAESSYKNYRAKLRNVNPPCIPYIGVYLLDLTYMEDGNPDKVNGLINFAKRKLIHRLIQDVQIYQDTVYDFDTDDEILHSIIESVAMPVQEEYPLLPSGEQTKQPFLTVKAYEDHLFELSLQREPRGAERGNIE